MFSWSKFISCCKGIFVSLVHFLNLKEIPLWVTLALALGGVWGANEYLPRINHQHEYSKMKPSFIMQSLNDLNEQTSLLISLLTEVYEEFKSDEEVSVESKIRLAKIISALQWVASEISMFLEDGEGEELLRYRRSLNKIRDCSGLESGELQKDCLDRATLEFLQSAEDLGKVLTRFD